MKYLRNVNILSFAVLVKQRLARPFRGKAAGQACRFKFYFFSFVCDNINKTDVMDSKSAFPIAQVVGHKTQQRPTRGTPTRAEQ